MIYFGTLGSTNALGSIMDLRLGDAPGDVINTFHYKALWRWPLYPLH